MPWPVEIDGFEYQPIPESWLDHPNAVDLKKKAGPTLFAVSAAPWGSKTLRVRYASIEGEVLRCYTAATELENGGPVPLALETGKGWPRSLRPGANDPHDYLRGPEWEHFEELWSERVDAELEFEARDQDTQQRELVTDGGQLSQGTDCSGGESNAE